jgi:hypothetical protein
MDSSSFGSFYAASNFSRMDVAVARGFETIDDDVDTAWSRWDVALTQEQASRLGLGQIGEPLPCIVGNATNEGRRGDELTQPMALEDLSLEQRKNRALVIIEEHHPRIARSIQTLWGYRECISYVNKLILEGHDVKGHARVGFNHMAAQAMLVLTEVHDAMFGVVGTSATTGAAEGNGWNLIG